MESDPGYNFASGPITTLTTLAVRHEMYIFVLVRPGVVSELVDFSDLPERTSLALVRYNTRDQTFSKPSVIVTYNYSEVFPINLQAEYHNGRIYLIVQGDFGFVLNNGKQFSAAAERVITVLCKLDEFFTVSHYLPIVSGRTGDTILPYDFTITSDTVYFVGTWRGFLELPGSGRMNNSVPNIVYGSWRPFGKQTRDFETVKIETTDMDRCTSKGNGGDYEIMFTNSKYTVTSGQIVTSTDRCSVEVNPNSKGPITNRRPMRKKTFSRPCLYMTLSHNGELYIAGTKVGDGCNLTNADLLILKLDMNFKATNQYTINARFNVDSSIIVNTAIVEQDGDLYLAGLVAGRYNVGRSLTLNSVGRLSQYVVKLSDDEWRWAKQITNDFTTGSNVINTVPRPVYNGLTLNLIGKDLSLGSHFWRRIEFDDTELTGSGASDYYLINLRSGNGDFNRPRIIPCSNISGYNHQSAYVDGALYTLLTRSINPHLGTVSVVKDAHES